MCVNRFSKLAGKEVCESVSYLKPRSVAVGPSHALEWKSGLSANLSFPFRRSQDWYRPLVFGTQHATLAEIKVL